MERTGLDPSLPEECHTGRRASLLRGGVSRHLAGAAGLGRARPAMAAHLTFAVAVDAMRIQRQQPSGKMAAGLAQFAQGHGNIGMDVLQVHDQLGTAPGMWIDSSMCGWSIGRNPATGEAIKIKASKKVAFRAAKELKEAI